MFTASSERFLKCKDACHTYHVSTCNRFEWTQKVISYLKFITNPHLNQQSQFQVCTPYSSLLSKASGDGENKNKQIQRKPRIRHIGVVCITRLNLSQCAFFFDKLTDVLAMNKILDEVLTQKQRLVTHQIQDIFRH